MKALVTGAKGFLGSFLLTALKKRGYETFTTSSETHDLRKPNALLPFSGVSFDYIFHLAAWTQAGDFCLKHPSEQFFHNQLMNTYTLNWWVNHQPQAKFIAIGTSCSYPEGISLEEKNYLTGKPIDSLFTYAMTKRMLLTGLQAAYKQYGLNYLYVIPSTLYGPKYHMDGRQMHFIFDLMRKIILAKHGGSEVILWGDGYQKRELIHVEEFVDALLLLNDKHQNDHFNIGSGKEYTIREFAKMICDYLHYDFSLIRFDETAYVGARSKILDIKKLQEAINGYRKIDLKEGIAATTKWLEEQLMQQREAASGV